MDLLQTRLEQLQQLADLLLEKLRQRIEGEDPETMNPQALKHMTGMMKDIRDIQLTRVGAGQEGETLQVCLEGELVNYSE